MNNKRREQVRRVIGMLEQACDDVLSISSDENDAFDNLPEGIQMSDRGEAMEGAIQNLDYAEESINEAIGSLEEAMV